ncbi:unnamed protein product [Clonostachys rhizophaga]|uniref:Uncharacterized protein n=1 Tax=Clonostachys rhizophaga TaxID=160324 RepID=A0A9N9VWH0_9HYPO|nr:unnamed protein product [Clonostachys rhizophaga]
MRPTINTDHLVEGNPFERVDPDRVQGMLNGYEVYPLHFLDNHPGFKETYTYTLQFNDVLDAQLLHVALRRLLEHGDWRKFGGRLRTNKVRGRRTLEVHVPTTITPDYQTVAYSHQVIRSKLREHPLGSLLPQPTGERGSIQEGADHFRDFSAGPNVPKDFSAYLSGDVPIIALHVICFADATLVSLAWPHVLMDGTGLQILLNCWSHMLAGRENAVPPVLGARHDFISRASESALARDEMNDENCLLRGCTTLRLAFNVIWDQLSVFFSTQKPVNRTVYLPKRAVQKLRNQALFEIQRANPGHPDKLWVSESDVILALFVHTTALCEPTPRPVTVFGAFDLRSRLPDYIDKSGVYIQNMAWVLATPLDADTALGSMGEVALAHRRSLQEQTTQGRVLALLRKLKQQSDSGDGMTVFSGPPNAILYPAGNLTKLNFCRAANFLPAVFRTGDDSPTRRNPPGTCVYHHKGFWNEDRVSKKGMFILGQDWNDNYWITGWGMPDIWRRIQETLDELGPFRR